MKLEAFSYHYPISHLRKERSDVKEGDEEEPFQNKTLILDAPGPRAAAQGHGEKLPAEAAAGSKQGQQLSRVWDRLGFYLELHPAGPRQHCHKSVNTSNQPHSL